MASPTAARAAALTALAALALAAGCAGPAGSPATGEAPARSGSQAVAVVPGARAVPGRPLDFTAPTLAGDRLDAGTLAGTPVVLWFWAPWCTICRVEAPGVAAAAAELGGEVTVLGVPGRGPVEDMRRFVADTGTAGLRHVVDADGDLWRRFGVVSQPSFAFVAPDGSAQVFGGALTREQLRDAAAALAQG